MIVYSLSVVDIHRGCGHIAEEPHPLAVGRDVNILAGVRAVDLECIAACLTFDHIIAIARVPNQRVVAVAGDDLVVAGAGADDIVATETDNLISTSGSDDHIIAIRAGDRARCHTNDRRWNTVAAALSTRWGCRPQNQNERDHQAQQKPTGSTDTQFAHMHDYLFQFIVRSHDIRTLATKKFARPSSPAHALHRASRS